MRIAIVLSHINQSTQWVWFSEELISRGISHFYVIINPTYPALADELKALGVEVHYFPQRGKWQLLTTVMKTVALFRKNKVDLVHSELPLGNLVGQLAARICRIKARVVTCENTTWAEDFKSKRQSVIDRFAYHSAGKVIALTSEAAEYLHAKYGIPKEKLYVIHHSLKQSDYLDIDPSRVEKLRNDLGIATGEFIVGMVARFEFWKGHGYAVAAMRELVAEFPGIRLHIFGGKGESYEAVMADVQAYGLSKHIIHHEYVADNKALYALFDVHLHVPVNALCETFGITIIEGMITGTPQVLTRSGISTLTARDNVNCLVVDYGSVESIHTAVRKLVTDDGLRKRLGEQAREDAVKLFNYADKVDQHLEVYGSLLKRH